MNHTQPTQYGSRYTVRPECTATKHRRNRVYSIHTNATRPFQAGADGCDTRLRANGGRRAMSLRRPQKLEQRYHPCASPTTECDNPHRRWRGWAYKPRYQTPAESTISASRSRVLSRFRRIVPPLAGAGVGDSYAGRGRAGEKTALFPSHRTRAL